jgi:hypothetical protein
MENEVIAMNKKFFKFNQRNFEVLKSSHLSCIIGSLDFLALSLENDQRKLFLEECKSG